MSERVSATNDPLPAQYGFLNAEILTVCGLSALNFPVSENIRLNIGRHKVHRQRISVERLLLRTLPDGGRQ
jgi:hypothetical protein